MSNSVLSFINEGIADLYPYEPGRSIYDMFEHLLITIGISEENDYFLNHFSKLI